VLVDGGSDGAGVVAPGVGVADGDAVALGVAWSPAAPPVAHAANGSATPAIRAPRPATLR